MSGDWNIGGVFVAAFAVELALAFLLLLACRRLLARLGFEDAVANAPLVEAGLYVCILAVLVLLL